MGRLWGLLCGLLLTSCATIPTAIQCLPPGIPSRADWHPLVTLAIPRCADCQQIWAEAGPDILVHAVLVQGLVGVVRATRGNVPGPMWEDPGVLIPRIKTVRPQPDPRQSCQWQQLGEEM